MKFIQNEGTSVLIIGLCRNLTKSIKRNNDEAALDCDLGIHHLKHLVLTVTVKFFKSNNFRTAELQLTLGTSAARYQKKQRDENTGINSVRHVWPVNSPAVSGRKLQNLTNRSIVPFKLSL